MYLLEPGGFCMLPREVIDHSPAHPRVRSQSRARSGEAEQAAEAPPEAEASTPTEPVWPRDYSFFVFAPNNPIRVQCISFVSSPHFDNGILGLIVISTSRKALPRVVSSGARRPAELPG